MPGTLVRLNISGRLGEKGLPHYLEGSASAGLLTLSLLGLCSLMEKELLALGGGTQVSYGLGFT